MEKNFETEVLTRLAVIESKLDGYKEVKKIAYANEQTCSQNTKDIADLESRVTELEKKPTKRYDGIVEKIITVIIETILIFVLVTIGLKK